MLTDIMSILNRATLTQKITIILALICILLIAYTVMEYIERRY